MPTVEYLNSLVDTFREANAANPPHVQIANEARISALANAVETVTPFLGAPL
jgi:hypothetical protein